MAFNGTASNRASLTDVGDVGCVALSINSLLGISVGTFRFGLHPLHSLHCFFFYEKEGVLRRHSPLACTQQCHSERLLVSLIGMMVLVMTATKRLIMHTALTPS